MKTLTKKIVSILLVLSSLFSFCAVGASASGNDFVYSVGGKNYSILTGTSPYSIFTITDNVIDAQLNGSNGTTAYYYSDGYFMDDPTQYNTHLCSMSMVVAGACSYSTSANCTKLFSDLGFENIQPNSTFASGASTDNSIGFVLATKSLLRADGTDTGKKLIAIAIRGASYGHEFYSNFMMGNAGDHTGFSDSANIIVTALNKYISDNNLTSQYNSGNLCFWLTGHSRAGSVANLTSTYLVNSLSLKANPCSVFCYAFAPCHCGNSDNTNLAAYSCIHNVINKNDLVTYVSPTCFGFMRYGVDHEISSLVGTSAYKALLNIEAPGYEYNDSFHAAYLNPNLSSDTNIFKLISFLVSYANGEVSLDDLLYTYSDSEQITLSQYLTDFNANVFEAWNSDRTSSYTQKTFNTSGFDSASTTLQDSLSYLVGFYNSLSNEKLTRLVNWSDGMVDAMSSFIQSNYKNILNWTQKGLFGIAIVGKSDKDSVITSLWNVLNSHTKDSVTMQSLLESIEPGSYTKLKQRFPVLIDFIFRIVSNDYNKDYSSISVKKEQSLYLLGTLLYNALYDGNSLFIPHMLTTYLPAVQSADSYYTTANYRLAVNGVAQPIMNITAKAIVLAGYDTNGRMISVKYFDPSKYTAGEVVNLTTQGSSWKLMFVNENLVPVCGALSSQIG